MASRLNGTNAYFSRTANLVNTASGGTYTAMTWMYHTSTTGFRNIFFAGIDDFSNQSVQIDSGTLNAWVNTSGTNGSTISTNTWYHVTVVKDGNSTNNYKVYLNGALDIQMNILNFTANKMTMGAWNANADYASARFCGVKIWSTALTAAEIAQEQYVLRPVKAESLLGFYPMFPGSGERVRDYSGNGYNWTENGTVTDEDPPPIGWGGSFYLIPYASSGGTTYTSTLTGAGAGVGAVVKEPRKTLIGTGAGVGALVKQTNKVLTGAGAGVGVLVRRTNKTLAASGAGVGSVIKQTNKLLAGAGASVGVISKLTNKAFAGSGAGSGTLSTAAVFTKILTGAGAGVGVLVKRTNKTLAASGAGVGSLIKQTNKLLAGAGAGIGTLIKRTSKAFTGSGSGSGALNTATIYTKILTGAGAGVGVLVKRTNKIVSGAGAGVGTISKIVQRILSGAGSAVGGLISTFIPGSFTPDVPGHVSSRNAAVGLVRVSDRAIYSVTASGRALYNVTGSDKES